MPVLIMLSGMLASFATPHSAQAQPNPWQAPTWLMSPEQVRQYFRSDYLKDKDSLKAVNPGGDQTRKIKRIVQAFVSQLPQESKANLPRQVVERLLSDIHQGLTSAQARQMMMEEAVTIAPDLMNHPDDLVRYNMLAILVQLSVKPTQIQGGVETPAVPFNPAYRVFLQVIQDQDQFLGCRILAARGLARICRDGENAPSSNERSDIATAVVKTLAANPPSTADGNWWFRLRLIETLGYVDRLDNTATQPIVLEALLDIISNPAEVWLNRAVAAQSISQLPYSSSTNIQLITSEIVSLLNELTEAFNKAPSAPDLRDAFKRLYLAFRPATAKQARDKKWGLLAQVERPGLSGQAPYVKAAWTVSYPLVRQFLETGSTTEVLPAIPADQLQAAVEWVQKNPPSNRQVMPNGKTYPEKKPDEPQPAVSAK